MSLGQVVHEPIIYDQNSSLGQVVHEAVPFVPDTSLGQVIYDPSVDPLPKNTAFPQIVMVS